MAAARAARVPAAADAPVPRPLSRLFGIASRRAAA
jgi:hypothetical protein